MFVCKKYQKEFGVHFCGILYLGHKWIDRHFGRSSKWRERCHKAWNKTFSSTFPVGWLNKDLSSIKRDLYDVSSRPGLELIYHSWEPITRRHQRYNRFHAHFTDITKGFVQVKNVLQNGKVHNIEWIYFIPLRLREFCPFYKPVGVTGQRIR
jgi:hypothetical protein